MPQIEISPGMHAAFDELIAPLERQAGKRLNEPARSIALEAFALRPDAVRALTRDALQRGRAPLALFVKMVADGDHLVAGANVKRALEWARRTAPVLDPDHREEIIEAFHLDPVECAAVRAQIERSLGAMA